MHPEGWTKGDEQKYRDELEKGLLTGHVRSPKLVGVGLASAGAYMTGVYGGGYAVLADLTLKDRMNRWKTSRAADAEVTFEASKGFRLNDDDVHREIRDTYERFDKKFLEHNPDLMFRKKYIVDPFDKVADVVGGARRTRGVDVGTSIVRSGGIPVAQVVRKIPKMPFRLKMAEAVRQAGRFSGAHAGYLVGAGGLAIATGSLMWSERKFRDLSRRDELNISFINRKDSAEKAWKTRRQKYGPNGLSGV